MQNPALDFVTQALNDFGATLPPSARHAFAVTANQALADIKAQLEKPALAPSDPA